MKKEINLILSLVALERLYLIYKKSSFFTEEVAREFLDACWESIIVNDSIPRNKIKKANSLTKSKKIPSEENCVGIDFYALSFLSGLDCLLAYLQNNDLHSLNFIYEELEVNLLDHYLLQDLFKEKYFIVTAEHENIVRQHPRMIKLRQAIESERHIVEVENRVDAKMIDKLRKDFVFDLI